MNNKKIADYFEKLSKYAAIDGANPFKIRAYEDAAEFIRYYPNSFEEMVKRGEDLTKFPHIGKKIEEKIYSLINDGYIPTLKRYEDIYPSSILELLSIEGIGPKRARELYDMLGVDSISKLKEVASEHLLSKLPYFSKRFEDSIINAPLLKKDHKRRFLYVDVEDIAKDIVEYLKRGKGIKEVVIAGSFRRKKESVGDLDIVIVADDRELAVEHFISYDKRKSIIYKGKSRSTIILKNTLQVDLKLSKSEDFGTTLNYFTGSRSHTLNLRVMAKKMGWKVNEYGIFNEDGEDIAKESEEEFYKAFGFDFIEPELREDRGEFEASKNHKLPNLVEIDDLFGDLNLKSKFSGGVLGFKDILDESKKRGYKQIAIADLIKREDISAYLKSFDEIQRDSKDVEILRAIEVEIDCSGKVKIEDELLKEFDIVIAIIKDRCDLNRSMQTKRILKAIENRFITTIAHLRDRVIQKRDPMQIELGLVFEMIAKRGLAIEIDANPFRLDLDDISIKLAKEYGLKFSIGSHAKNREEFDFLRYGLYQARRGWLEKRELLNCSMIRG